MTEFDYSKLEIGVIQKYSDGSVRLRISDQISFYAFFRDNAPKRVDVIRHKKNDVQAKFSIQEFMYIDKFVELIKNFEWNTKSHFKISFVELLSKKEIVDAMADKSPDEIAEIITLMLEKKIGVLDMINLTTLKNRRKNVAEFERAIESDENENWFQEFLKNKKIIGYLEMLLILNLFMK